jgi:hypothetical protein
MIYIDSYSWSHIISYTLYYTVPSRVPHSRPTPRPLLAGSKYKNTHSRSPEFGPHRATRQRNIISRPSFA